MHPYIDVSSDDDDDGDGDDAIDSGDSNKINIVVNG